LSHFYKDILFLFLWRFFIVIAISIYLLISFHNRRSLPFLIVFFIKVYCGIFFVLIIKIYEWRTTIRFNFWFDDYCLIGCTWCSFSYYPSQRWNNMGKWNSRYFIFWKNLTENQLVQSLRCHIDIMRLFAVDSQVNITIFDLFYPSWSS